MRKKVFYVTMAAIFAATSCTNELPNEQPTDVINIVASISSQTRAPQLTNDGSGSFSQGDKMSLFLAETDGESHAVDFDYGSGILTWSSLGLSGNNAQISLAACYPQQKEMQDDVRIQSAHGFGKGFAPCSCPICNSRYFRNRTPDLQPRPAPVRPDLYGRKQLHRRRSEGAFRSPQCQNDVCSRRSAG